MAKASSHFVCQSCGTSHPKWTGKCDGCSEWNTLVEEALQVTTPKGLSRGKGLALERVTLDAAAAPLPRTRTHIGELDRVLGGGLVPGSAILVGGDPGIGESTLLLQAVSKLAQEGTECLYISGEESVGQIQLRAQRLGLAHPGVSLAAANSVRDILASLAEPEPPRVVVIDSIQTMFVDNIDSAPGTVAQVRAASHELIRHAKKRGITMLLVGHVTKDGQIAGPKVLEHMVDTVLYFEGDRGVPFRILRAVKNRFGATDEIGVFETGEHGLTPVENPSSLFLAQREAPVSGSAIFAGLEGSRPVLVEIQALVSPSFMATPRRAVVGWDAGRLAMVLAVLEARAGVKFSDREVYLNVAGGLRINEPAADLAAAAALVSALADIPLPPLTVVFGEIGLSGEVRAVGRSELRLKEAEKLGFRHSWCPPPRGTAAGREIGLGTKPLHHVQDLLKHLTHEQRKWA